MGIERELAVAVSGSTLLPNEIADVSSSLEGLHELREWFCGVKSEEKVCGLCFLGEEREGDGNKAGREEERERGREGGGEGGREEIRERGG